MGFSSLKPKTTKVGIFGSERQKQWTQSIYRQKNKFQNPIHQNYKHIKTLESLLEDIVPSNVFFGIVIFVGSAEFKSKIPKGVFLDRDWIKYIKSFKSEIIYSDQIQMIKQRLEIAPLEKSWKTNRIHVENLKQCKGNS